MADSAKHVRSVAAVFTAATAVLILHSTYYHPFFADDALISLRYADRFLEGKGLTWTDGPRVEGYSNLLWILLTSALGALEIDLIVAARVLGVLAMAGVVWFMAWPYAGRSASGNWLPLTVGLGFFCIAAPTAVWAIGGMEQPLCAVLIAASILSWSRVAREGMTARTPVLVLSLVLGLLCLARPDGPIFTLAAVLALLLEDLRSKRRPGFKLYVTLLAIPFLCVAGQLVFRFLYYGDLVPNTARVKIALSTQRFSGGLVYVAHGLRALLPLSLVALAAIGVAAASRRVRTAGVYLLTITILWLAYLVFIGGDIFPAFRHFVPLVVVFAFGLVEGLDVMLARTGQRRATSRARTLLVAGTVVCTAPFVYAQFSTSDSRRAKSERWEWDGQVVGNLMKEAFQEQQPLVAVTASGCIPYWSELPAVDMLGLNDHYLPRHPPVDFGTGKLGHELGDARYVMSREPDIVCFHAGTLTASYPFVQEMLQMNEFRQLYTPVAVLGSPPRSVRAVLWFRKYSSRIGIQVDDARITVPGFLLNAEAGTVAYLDATGALVVNISARHSVRGVIDVAHDTNWDVEVDTARRGLIQSRLDLVDGVLVVTLFTNAPHSIPIRSVTLTR